MNHWRTWLHEQIHHPNSFLRKSFKFSSVSASFLRILPSLHLVSLAFPKLQIFGSNPIISKMHIRGNFLSSLWLISLQPHGRLDIIAYKYDQMNHMLIRIWMSYQSCKRTVRSSRYIVFDRKSMPIVACNSNNNQSANVAQVKCLVKWNKIMYLASRYYKEM